ncbi:MAG: LamG-like jellyroll fold domain-containing protein [Limisphaerales bacterium]
MLKPNRRESGAFHIGFPRHLFRRLFLFAFLFSTFSLIGFSNIPGYLHLLPKIQNADAASYTCTASVTGNWSNPATWGGTCGSNRYPGEDQAGDTVIVNTGITVTLDVSPAFTIGSLALNAAGTANGVTWSGTNSLEVTGSTTINAPTAAVSSTLAVGTGTFTADGLVTINGGGTANWKGIVSASTGTITLNGGLTFGGTAAQAQFTTTGAAILNIVGTVGAGGTLVINSGTTANFTGTSAINGAYTFGIVNVNSGGTLTLGAGTITFAGNLTVSDTSTLTMGNFAFTESGSTTVGGGSSGTINIGTAGSTGTRTFTGLVTVNAGGTFDLTGGTPATTFAGGITNNSANTFKTGTGTATISATSALSGGGPMTFGGSVTISASAVLTNNDTGTTTFSSSVTGGNSSSGITTGLNSDTVFLGSGTNTLSTGVLTPYNGVNTIEYDLGGAQTLKAPTTNSYYNLVLGGTSAKTLVSGVTAVTNNLTLSGTASVSATVVNLSIGGALMLGTGTAFTATNGFTVGITGGVSITGTGQVTNNTSNGFTIGGNLSGTGTFTNGTNALLNLGGSASVTTLTATAAGNTVNYTSTTGATIKGTTYRNLAANASGQTFTLGGIATTTGNLTISSGTTLDVSSNNYALNIAGNFANSGTFNAETGTVTLNGITSATSSVSGNNTFYNLVIAKANKPVIAFTSGTTQTILGSLSSAGDSTHQITITATSSGMLSPFTFTQSSGSELVSYTTLSYSTAAGGATWSAPSAVGDVDGGNNSGWSFGPAALANVYYSVGQVKYNDAGGNLMTGTPTVTISGGTATFSVAQTGNIGVGDRVTYNGTSVAWIAGRTSQTVWNLETVTGGIPANVTGVTVNSIGHEYNSLNAAVNGALDSNHLNSTSLVALNVILNFPCYYDNGPDTTSVLFPAVTTSASNYIRIYTATSSTEANQSQRHTGKWTSTAYSLQVGDTANHAAINAEFKTDFLRIDGLQIKVTVDSSEDDGILVAGKLSTDTTDFQISNNIIVGVLSGSPTESSGVYAGFYGSVSTDVAHVWNNIIYGFSLGASTAFAGIKDGGYLDVYAYNNTMYDDYYGIFNNTSSGGVVTAKNNIVQDSTVGYLGTYINSSTNNISDHADAPGTNAQGSTTVAFVSTSTSDFHLASNDTAAKDQGVNLSADPNIAFNTDIDGQPRPYGPAWDIGADEYNSGMGSTFAFTGPLGGDVNSASGNFTVTPDYLYTGTITITPSGSGSTGLSPIVLTFSNSDAPQTFTITPTVAGSITLTSSNDGSLVNPSNLIYVSTQLPIVTTQAASALTSTGATLNGTIASIGGSSPTTIGFVYGTTAAYGLTTVQTGSFSAGPFSSTISGLTCGITYHYSTYAVNSFGTSTYPADSTFTPPCALLGWWKFDDGSGTTALDSSGNGYNGTVYGTAPVWTTGQIGGALSFDGTDNYVDAGNNVDINGNQMTISVWVDTANNVPDTYIGNMRWTGVSGYALNFNTGVFYWGNGTSQQRWNTGITTPNNTWTLITVVMANSTLYYYENGALATSTPETISGNVGTGVATLKIGRDPVNSQYFFSGSLDDVQIYNQALSAGQIATYYAQNETFSPSNHTPTTYYVSAASGNDANPGTVASPFQTIQEGANTALPGDTVIVEDGTYSAMSGQALVTLNSGGLPNEPITFESQNPGGAVLNGESNAVQDAWQFTNSASYITIKGFEIFGFASGGITFNTVAPESNIDILNNNIHDIGRLCSDSTFGNDGVYTPSTVSSSLIEGNIFHDIGRFSPSENGCSPATQYYMNHDHGVYIEGSTNITVANNIFYNLNHGWGVHVYSVNNSYLASNITIENNTFSGANPYEPGQIILATPGVTNAVIQNNIFYGPATDGINFYNCCAMPTFINVTVTNNITYGAPVTTFNPSGVTFSGNLDNADPLLVASSTYNFQLASGISPAIDAGTSAGSTSTTTDYSGNPIYGTPDIGAYEYQPPFTIGTDMIDPTGNIRIYGDGKYRYLTATSSTPSASLFAAPIGGFPTYDAVTTRPAWLDISNITWGSSDSWTASSSIATSTVFTVGNLTPNTPYFVKVDGATSTAFTGASCSNYFAFGNCGSDASGNLSLTYTGGYTTHTFLVAPDPSAQSVMLTAPSAGTVSGTVSLAATTSSAANAAGVQFILDGTTPIGSFVTSTSSPYTYTATWNSTAASNGSHTLSAVALDTSGEYATSSITVTVSNAVSAPAPTSSGGSSGPSGGSSFSSSGGGRGAPVLPIATSTPVASDCPTGFTCTPAATPTCNILVPTSRAVFTRSLALGSTGSDVQALQQFLNSHSFTVASSGNGSPGLETSYFGPATKAALIRFQNAYAAQVLAPSSLTEGTGYFGSATMKEANLLNASTASRVCLASTASTTPAAAVTAPFPATASPFTRDLTLGSTGPDVTALQIFLNTHGFIIAVLGPGSPGHETTYFGPATRAAVEKFQQEYAAQILTPSGLTVPTGFFGPASIKLANTMG